MLNRVKKRTVCVALLAALCVAAAPEAAPAKKTSGTPPVVKLGKSSSPSGANCHAYTFKVKQTPSARKRRSVWGEFCSSAKLTSKTPVQVLLHGGSYNHAYWDIPYEPQTYSYVYGATKRGFATLNFDQIGAGKSYHPKADEMGFDVTSYVTHQLITALRRGKLGPRFSKVIVNGHSMGAMTAELEASRFHDVNGVIVSGLGHNIGLGGAPVNTFYPAASDPRFAGKVPAGYTTTVPGARSSAFVSHGAEIDPAVLAVEESTLKDTFASTLQFSLFQYSSGPTVTKKINVPVLFAQGHFDVLWCSRTLNCDTDPQAAKEKTYYKKGVSFTRLVVPRAGHSLNTSITVQTFYDATFAWLTKHRLAPR